MMLLTILMSGYHSCDHKKSTGCDGGMERCEKGSQSCPLVWWTEREQPDKETVQEKIDSDSDSDEDAVVTSGGSANKKSDKDAQLEKIVNELKELHEQQYTPMQYRIWGKWSLVVFIQAKPKHQIPPCFLELEGKSQK